MDTHVNGDAQGSVDSPSMALAEASTIVLAVPCDKFRRIQWPQSASHDYFSCFPPGQAGTHGEYEGLV